MVLNELGKLGDKINLDGVFMEESERTGFAMIVTTRNVRLF